MTDNYYTGSLRLCRQENPHTHTHTHTCTHTHRHAAVTVCLSNNEPGRFCCTICLVDEHK